MPTMQAPDPQYLFPAIHPLEYEKQRAFAEKCASGDLEEITSIVNSTSLSSEYLNWGVRSAIHNKHLEITAFLLDQTSIINREAASAAAFKKSIEVWELFLKKGWDINSPVFDNGTTLLTVLDDENLVTWFFNHGATLSHLPTDSSNPTYADPILTCLNAAACKSTIATFDMLLAHGASKTHSIPLHTVAGCGSDDSRIPMMAHLINIGYDVNATDEEVMGGHGIGTPLHHAVRRHAMGKIKFLLENGANPQKKNQVKREGAIQFSALEMAEGSGLSEIVAMMR